MKPTKCPTSQDGTWIHFLYLLQFIHFLIYTAQLFAVFHPNSNVKAVECYDLVMRTISE